MLLKRAKTSRLFFSQNYRLKKSFYSNWKQFQVFKIAKLEFKVTLHYGLWTKMSLKNPFGKVVFQILAKIEMMRKKKQKQKQKQKHAHTPPHTHPPPTHTHTHTKIGYLAVILKRYNISFILFPGIWLWLVYIYFGYKWLKHSDGKVVFLGWVPWNPHHLLGHQQEWKYLGHLRLRSFLVQTNSVCHVWCNFYPGCTCRTTVILGKLKGDII